MGKGKSRKSCRPQSGDTDCERPPDLLEKSRHYPRPGKTAAYPENGFSQVEDVTDTGQRIDLDISASVTVSRPNRLRSERKGELLHQVFTYDGKALTLHSLSDNVYATEAVPDTFEGMFKYLYESLGFGLPVSDLIYGDAFPLLMEDVTFAAVAGKTYIDGTRCDHLLFSRPGVDFQVWIEDGGKPLPRKYVVTDTSYPGLMSISTVMSDWNVNPTVKDADFSFTPPKGAQAINFMPF